MCKYLFFVVFYLLCFVPNIQATVSCLPQISVEFTCDSVDIRSDKDLSNVVLQFCDESTYKFDGLSGLTGTFSYQGKELLGVWVKSGCNSSGDGPGFGEFFLSPYGCECVKPTPTPTPTPTVDCLGVPNGTAEYDECGVCDGDNSTCSDCFGKPNGKAEYDDCGVCGGNNSTCSDCLGVPNGSAKVDQCGVCEGDNSCLDCRGVPYGDATFDQCGVCEGDNSCLDCLGVPNGDAVVDSCGVCGGDGGTLVKINIDKRKTLRLVNNVLNVRTLPYIEREDKCKKLSNKNKRILKAKNTAKRIRVYIKTLEKFVKLCPDECINNISKKQTATLKKLLEQLYDQARLAQLGSRNACNDTKKSKQSATRKVVDIAKVTVDNCKQTICN